jgi:hypothetical protein
MFNLQRDMGLHASKALVWLQQLGSSAALLMHGQ